MKQGEALDRIILEVRQRGVMCSQNYIPTTDHYIPLRLLSYYLNLAYGAGFDEGKKQNAHGKPVMQLKDGKEIKTWPSQWDAEQFYKLSKGALWKALSGKKIKIKGFDWRRV